MISSTIAVVEDEIVVAMELEERLRSMGYQVTGICASGQDAILEVNEKLPDLVLMDIRLDGELDGIQTAELIRRRHDIPIVYLTAYADDTTVQRAKQTEPFGYLIKPFSETELRTTIEVALYKHQQEQKAKEASLWFSATIDILGAGVLVTDRDGFIIHMNHVAEALTGWPHEEATGKHLTEVYLLRDPSTGRIMGNPVAKPLKVGSVPALFRGVLISRIETEIEIEQTIVPTTDSKSGFFGVVFAFQEISRQAKESQEWFNHAANLYLTATLSCADGEYDKAESFFKRTLLLFEKHLGGDHPKVANVLKDLADLYEKTGRSRESRDLKKKVARLGADTTDN